MAIRPTASRAPKPQGTSPARHVSNSNNSNHRTAGVAQRAMARTSPAGRELRPAPSSSQRLVAMSNPTKTRPEGISFKSKGKLNNPSSQPSKNPSTSLMSRVSQPKNLLMIAGGGTTAGLMAGAAALAIKVGPVAAGSIIVQNIMLFTSPGVYALGTALNIAANTAVGLTAFSVKAVAAVTLPVLLPILSTIVVTTLTVGLAIYLGHLLLQAMKDRLNAFAERVGAKLDETMVGSAVKTTAVAIWSAFSPIDEAEENEPSPSFLSSLTSYLPSFCQPSVVEEEDSEVSVVQMLEDLGSSQPVRNVATRMGLSQRETIFLDSKQVEDIDDSGDDSDEELEIEEETPIGYSLIEQAEQASASTPTKRLSERLSREYGLPPVQEEQEETALEMLIQMNSESRAMNAVNAFAKFA